MNTNNKFYSWYINPDNENEVIIYKQEKEDENTYDCISHIIEQLLEENPQYKFHLNWSYKIERVDNATNEIMDEIRDYFWKTHDIDLSEYYPNNADDKFINSRDADDDVYTIIHNKLKETWKI